MDDPNLPTFHDLAKAQINECAKLERRNRNTALKFIEREARKYRMHIRDGLEWIEEDKEDLLSVLPISDESIYKFNVEHVLTLLLGNTVRVEPYSEEYVIRPIDPDYRYMDGQTHDELFDLIGEIWMNAAWFKFKGSAV
jgi:hypothetical protein